MAGHGAVSGMGDIGSDFAMFRYFEAAGRPSAMQVAYEGSLRHTPPLPGCRHAAMMAYMEAAVRLERANHGAYRGSVAPHDVQAALYVFFEAMGEVECPLPLDEVRRRMQNAEDSLADYCNML